jgi:uncharacterized damage-inducible protein DinB
MERPTPNEYNPYFEGYINQVPEGNIISLMESQLDDTIRFLKEIPLEKHDYRYAENKWTVKEVLGHIIDCERIFSYRALRIARNDKTPLPGFEQDDYIKHANFSQLKFEDLIEQFFGLRKSTLLMFESFEEEYFTRIGVSNNHEISSRALAYIIVGHVTHHINIIKERYL